MALDSIHVYSTCADPNVKNLLEDLTKEKVIFFFGGNIIALVVIMKEQNVKVHHHAKLLPINPFTPKSSIITLLYATQSLWLEFEESGIESTK